jgi:hypothetical protein
MRQTLTGRQAIGEILVEKELITPEQLEAALEVQREHGGLLGEILVAQGLIDRIAIASVLVRQWSSTPLDAESDDVSSCEAADRGRTHVAELAALQDRIAELETTVARQDDELARRKEQLELLAEIVAGPLQAPSPAAPGRLGVVPKAAASQFAPPRLGDLLVSKGFITEEQLAEALVEARAQGVRLGRYLLRRQLIFEPELARTLSEQWAIPYLNLAIVSVDRHAAKLLPAEVGTAFDAIPVRYLEGAVQVAFADPSDGDALAAVREHIPAIAPAVAELSDIESLWRKLLRG